MRKETSSRHLLPLDGLRGLAVMTVFVFHFGGGTKSSFMPLRMIALCNLSGWSGVTLFFILSGFLITGILWDSRGAEHWWRNFYARRTLRIFPLYYAALLLVLIAAAFAGTLHDAAAKIWSPALFLQDIPGPDRSILATASPLRLYHFWSLAVEEHFYLLWPFLLLLQKDRKQALRLCVLVFVFSELVRAGICMVSGDPDRFDTMLFTRAGELAAGGWLAIAYRDKLWSSIQRPAAWLAAGGLATFVATSLISRTATLHGRLQGMVGLPAMTLFYASLLVLSLQGGLVAKIFSMGWLRWLGSISYGIYVFHVLLIAPFDWLAGIVARGHGENVFLAMRFFVALTGSILVAWLSFRFFEQPFLKLKRYFVARPEKASPQLAD